MVSDLGNEVVWKDMRMRPGGRLKMEFEDGSAEEIPIAEVDLRSSFIKCTPYASLRECADLIDVDPGLLQRWIRTGRFTGNHTMGAMGWFMWPRDAVREAYPFEPWHGSIVR